MNPLIEKFREFGPIDVQIETEQKTKVKTITKNKGDHFLRRGQYISSFFLLESGLVRYEKDHKEINTWFGFENIILGSGLPFFYNKPSTYQPWPHSLVSGDHTGNVEQDQKK
ncbi:hypothetical protein [Sphingobacterium sp.]|uniref:hypothetical protein n=1 Tax=Sphingobacterium sp. TaxID=341027 RepID=UPI0028A0E48A|nr:hypothetical protein [Sphingobacterium sp.]